MTPQHDSRLLPGPRHTILVLNGYQDLIDLLRLVLEDAGFAVGSANVDDVRRGEVDLKALVELHVPRVVVYDVSPPYERSWLYLEAMRSTGPLRNVPLVLTTTNEKRLRELVATSEPILEVFGKPFDLGQVVEAVRRAAGHQT
jgi:CheY-like chemotaxis protein